MAIVIFEVGVVAGAYSKKDQLDEIVNNGLNKTLKGIKENQGYNATWHLLQTEVRIRLGIFLSLFSSLNFEFDLKIGFFQLKCCGIDNPGDWKPVLGNQLPPSCCQKPIGDTTCVEKDAAQTGCKQALRDYLRDNLLIVAGLGVGAALIQVKRITTWSKPFGKFNLKFYFISLQLFLIVFACCLYSAFRRGN